MSDQYGATAGDDDLPLTFRREKEARERANRPDAGADPRDTSFDLRHDGRTESSGPQPFPSRSQSYEEFPPEPGVVTHFDVPFAHLVVFFLKAVFAAVPAIIVLGVILWFFGEILTTFYPELIKTEILIRFPN